MSAGSHIVTASVFFTDGSIGSRTSSFQASAGSKFVALGDSYSAGEGLGSSAGDAYDLFGFDLEGFTNNFRTEVAQEIVVVIDCHRRVTLREERRLPSPQVKNVEPVRRSEE